MADFLGLPRQQGRQFFIGISRVDDARRVIRRIDDDCPCMRCNGLFQGVQRNLEVFRIRRQDDGFGIGIVDKDRIFREERRNEDDFVIRAFDEGFEADGQRSCSPAGHVEIIGPYLGVISLVHVIGQALADRRITGSCRIAVDGHGFPRFQDVFNGFFDTGRGRDGRIADAEIEDIFLTDDSRLFLSISEEVTDDRSLGAQGVHFF